MTAAALREQQRALLEAIVTDEAPTDTPWLQAKPDGGAPLLGIYRHAYRARLLGALADNYPVLQRVMGDEAFAALAQVYLATHPSREPSIRWFGDKLSDFMAHAADLVPHPALIDLARMEWALRGAFDAADASTVGVGELAALPPEHWPALRWQPHPSVQLLHLQWAVEGSYRALSTHEAHSGDPEPEVPAPAPHPHTLLVWRRQFDTQWRSLGDDEASWLQAAMKGAPFATWCEHAAEGRDAQQAATAVALALQQWLHDGLIATWSTHAP